MQNADTTPPLPDGFCWESIRQHEECKIQPKEKTTLPAQPVKPARGWVSGL